MEPLKASPAVIPFDPSPSPLQSSKYIFTCTSLEWGHIYKMGHVDRIEETLILFIPASLHLVKDYRSTISHIFLTKPIFESHLGKEKEIMELMRLSKEVIEQSTAYRSFLAYEALKTHCDMHFPHLLLYFSKSRIETSIKHSALPEMGPLFKYLRPEQKELLLLKASIIDAIDDAVVDAICMYDQKHPIFSNLEHLEGIIIKAYLEGRLSYGVASAAMILAATRLEPKENTKVLHIETPEGQEMIKQSCHPRIINSKITNRVEALPLSGEKLKEEEIIRNAFVYSITQASAPLSRIEKIFIYVSPSPLQSSFISLSWAIAGLVAEFICLSDGEYNGYLVPMPTCNDAINVSIFKENALLHKGPFGFTKDMKEWLDSARRPISCPIVGAHYENVHDTILASGYDIYFHDLYHLLVCSQKAIERPHRIAIANFLYHQKETIPDKIKKRALIDICATITDIPDLSVESIKKDLERIGLLSLLDHPTAKYLFLMP